LKKEPIGKIDNFNSKMMEMIRKKKKEKGGKEKKSIDDLQKSLL
jgi:hypothetical protein